MNNEELFQTVIDNIISDNPALNMNLEARVSKNMLNLITSSDLDYNFVIANNEKLSEDYYHVVKTYGFDNFYDLYYYADSCDSLEEQLQKGGQKDLSRLKRVTRTVMRNGKPMKTTIYEDSGKEDGGNPMDSGSAEPQEIQPRNAKDLRMTMLGSDIVGADPKEVSKLKTEADKLNGTFVTDCNSYMVLQGENNELGGVAGFRKEGNYLYLVFYQSDEYTSGVAYRAFYMLLQKAWQEELGAMLDAVEDKTALELFKEYGLTKSGSCYKISKQKLQTQLGKP